MLKLIVLLWVVGIPGTVVATSWLGARHRARAAARPSLRSPELIPSLNVRRSKLARTKLAPRAVVRRPQCPEFAGRASSLQTLSPQHVRDGSKQDLEV